MNDKKDSETRGVLPESQQESAKTGSPVVYNFTDLQKKRDEFMKAVQNRANMLVENAKKESEQIKKLAEKRGYEEGYKKGHDSGVDKGRAEFIARAEAETAGLQKTMEKLISELQAHRELICAQAETDLLKLSVAIAGKIVKRAVKLEEIETRANVEEAIKLTSTRANIRIFINPADLEMMQEYQASLMRKFADIQVVEFASDPEITRGGCVVATSTGKVDMQLETQLAEIEKELAE